MELAICDCHVKRRVRTSLHCPRDVSKHSTIVVSTMYSFNGIDHVDLICKYWVLNFKCNVHENQSEPCILLNIYFFFYCLRCSREGFSIHFSAAGRQFNTSQLQSPSTVRPSTEPSPLTYSSFVGLVIFTYKFTFLYFTT